MHNKALNPTPDSDMVLVLHHGGAGKLNRYRASGLELGSLFLLAEDLISPKETLAITN